MSEKNGGGAVIARHPEAVRTLQITDPMELMDADMPETLAILQSHFLKTDTAE